MNRKSIKAKVLLSVVAILLILIFGCGYQYLYSRQKSQYRETISGFYRTYLHREPDKIGLNYWVTMAMSKWDIRRVEREGFKEAAAKGAR